MATNDYQRKIAKWAKRKAAIKQLVASGVSMADVGRRYRITRTRVHQLVRLP